MRKAVGDCLDEAVHQRLIDGLDVDDVQRRLDSRLDAAKGSTAIEADSTIHTPQQEQATLQVLADLASELDLDANSIRSVLESAMSIHGGRPQLSVPDEEGKSKIINPSLAGWSETIDETVRRSATGSGPGPVPYLAFSADPFIADIGGRQIFRPRYDVLMMHPGRPPDGQSHLVTRPPPLSSSERRVPVDSPRQRRSSRCQCPRPAAHRSAW
jgi:chorismate mutase